MKSSGNEKFDSIYEQCRASVFRAALYYIGSYDVAEEIFQDTFMELYTRIEKVNSATAENWLLRVTKNKSANYKKRMTNEMEKLALLEEEDAEAVTMNLENSIFDMERNKKFGILSKEIFLELRKENERWYEAVIEVYCAGKSQKEVAEEMNIRVEVLHAMLYRARDAGSSCIIPSSMNSYLKEKNRRLATPIFD